MGCGDWFQADQTVGSVAVSRKDWKSRNCMFVPEWEVSLTYDLENLGYPRPNCVQEPTGSGLWRTVCSRFTVHSGVAPGMDLGWEGLSRILTSCLSKQKTGGRSLRFAGPDNELRSTEVKTGR
jgi:hypothetical protein